MGGNNLHPYFVRQCGQSDYSKIAIKEGGIVTFGESNEPPHSAVDCLISGPGDKWPKFSTVRCGWHAMNILNPSTSEWIQFLQLSHSIMFCYVVKQRWPRPQALSYAYWERGYIIVAAHVIVPAHAFCIEPREAAGPHGRAGGQAPWDLERTMMVTDCRFGLIHTCAVGTWPKEYHLSHVFLVSERTKSRPFANIPPLGEVAHCFQINPKVTLPPSLMAISQ